ncbi:HD domain-containing protein [Psychrobacter sp. AOP7-A1-24]|uniref:HD domain-containing protein n=1 Tax=Psychrobacter sp. AOP7-A1-24 TaxID=3457646 RepID=UPI00402BF17A
MKTVSYKHDDFGKCFAQHLSALTSDISPKQIDRLWQDVAMHYGEPQRAYHTIDHIEQLLLQFESIKHHLTEPHIIALALYYHDVIYDPTRSDNELKSAEFATNALNPYLSSKHCQQIYALIMMTANHQIDALIDNDKYNDAAYLLDMDLSILGALWSTYQQYANEVRQEYAHVLDNNYRDGRTAVLEELLAHPKLYLTDHYYDQLETQARDNLKRELTLLAAL